jgi:radical SAM superfamily enzyme YgiQ (UPF0313 family)
MSLAPRQRRWIIMKVLLINPPQAGRVPALNIGLGHIAGALAKNGFEVEVLDIFLNEYQEETTEVILKQASFDCVGVSAMSTQYVYAKWLSEILKKYHPEKPVFLGGCLSTHSAELILKHTSFNFCVIGEGDVTAVELVGSLDKPGSVKGIAYKEGENVIFTDERDLVPDVNSLGMPAYGLFDIPSYLGQAFPTGGEPGRSLGVITARGCPYSCNYCSKGFPGVRLKSIEKLYEEIKYLNDTYKIGGISFYDELTILNKKRGYEICSLMKELGLKWSCQGRVNVVDLPLLKEMKRSGCVSVGFGVESGSPKILANMNKKQDIHQSRTAVRNSIKARLLPWLQMMFGYEGENFDTLKETEEFLASIPHPAPHFFVTTPLPGTQLYEESLKKGLINDEVSYLESLTSGYFSGRDILVNLTEFPEEKYYEIKGNFESRINRNFRRAFLKHPLIVLKITSFKAELFYYEVFRAIKLGIFWRSVFNRFRRILKGIA